MISGVRVSLLSLLALPVLAGGAPEFERQVIDDKVLIGYGVAVGDVDGDGREDILLADKRHFSWYENPGWEEHVLARNLSLRDNVCIAAEDIDGDGKVEIAVGGRWNPGNTIEPEASGSVHYLDRPANPRMRWNPVELYHDPTVHRMRWVRGGDGRFRLVVLPLHGIGNIQGKGENGVRVRTYLPDLRWPEQSRAWSHRVIERNLRMTHNFDDSDGTLYIGGTEGIVRRHVTDDSERDARIITPENSEPPTQGVSEVRKGRDFLAAIEPFHGNQLVIYREREGESNRWLRTELTGEMNQGHALAVADLFGDEREEIVVGWREPNEAGEMGIKVFYRGDTGEWENWWIDRNGIAAEDLQIADLNGDGKPDIVASGRKSQNLVIYFNP